MRRAVGSYGTPTNETLYRTADSLTRRHLQQWWDNFPPTELQGFLGAIVPPKTVPRRYSFHLAARAASSRVKGTLPAPFVSRVERALDNIRGQRDRDYIARRLDRIAQEIEVSQWRDELRRRYFDHPQLRDV